MLAVIIETACVKGELNVLRDLQLHSCVEGCLGFVLLLKAWVLLVLMALKHHLRAVYQGAGGINVSLLLEWWHGPPDSSGRRLP